MRGMKYYCKNCCEEVTEITQKGDIKPQYSCGCQIKPLTRRDVVEDFVRDARVRQLRAMHELMCLANDETLYGRWICFMPDEPNDDDFHCMAVRDEERDGSDDYNSCFNLFVRLISQEGARW